MNPPSTESLTKWYTAAMNTRGMKYMQIMLQLCEDAENYEECAVIWSVMQKFEQKQLHTSDEINDVLE